MLRQRRCPHPVAGQLLTSINLCLCVLILAPRITVPAPIRLVNVTQTSSYIGGRVEVYYNGTWGTICGDKVNIVTATTLCRILGYSSRGYPVKNSWYGEGTELIWLDGVRCSGNETDISQCSHRNWGYNFCGHYKDLGLVCSNDSAVSATIRLVDGVKTADSLSGRLETSIFGIIGTVCDHNANELTATTLCRILGYSRGYPITNVPFGPRLRVIWLDSVVCSGHETSISQCSHPPWGENDCKHHRPLRLVCSNDTTVSAKIRLVDGIKTANSLSGRLETSLFGVWGTVCQSNSNELTATTLCRILGYSQGYPITTNWFGPRSMVIWLDEVVCSGNETSISQCSHLPWGVNDCWHTKDLSLVCTNATTATMRLVNGVKTTNSLSGRLEMSMFGIWGTVCQGESNKINAVTLCRILGYSRGYQAKTAAYGEGSGVIWLENVVCSGKEASILQCSHLPLGSHTCGHHQDLGLVCSNRTTVSESLRLVNGTKTATSLSGRLEISVFGIWGTVCSGTSDDLTAKTLCRILGYRHGYLLQGSRAYGEGTGVIWLDDVVCSGNETSIFQCSHRPLGENDCGHYDDLGLVCANDTTAPIRLVNGVKTATSLSGGLETLMSGSWGAVCDGKFNKLTATTLCRILGYRNGYPVNSAGFGQGTGSVWINDVECSGNETSISQCSYREGVSWDCTKFDALGLACLNDTTESVPTRITGGENGSGWLTGRLEVFFAGQWGTVCSNKFNNAAATVVCSNLGYRFGNYIYRSYPWRHPGMIWLSGAICRGNETNIAQCEHDDWGLQLCGHYADVHIICANNQPESNPCLLPGFEPCGSRTDGCFSRSDRCDRLYNCRNSFDESTCP